MTALAPTLQAFFTDRLALQRQASSHTITAYRDAVKMLIVFAARQARQDPVPPGHRRPGRAHDRRVPEPPGKRPRQHRPDPQRPAGRDPLPVRLRRAAPPRARRRHPAGPGHPAQAVRQGTDHLPHRGRDHGPAGRPGPGHVDRPARPGPAHARLPDRAARHRAHQPGHQRRPPGNRRARQLPGQGPQTAHHPAHPSHRDGPARLARRARRPARRPAVRHPPRHPAQPRRPGTAHRQVHRHRRGSVPVPAARRRYRPTSCATQRP